MCVSTAGYEGPPIENSLDVGTEWKSINIVSLQRKHSGRQPNVDGFQFVTEQKVAWRDQDALGHVNNAVYATYFETARLEYASQVLGDQSRVFQLILAELTISYKSPAVLGETLLIGVRVSEIRNSSFIMETRMEDKATGRLIATGRAVMVRFDYGENKAIPVPQEWREQMARFEGQAV